MSVLKIDITGTPPTSEQLALWRREAGETMRLANRRKQILVTLCYGIGLLGFIVLIGFWRSGDLAGMDAGAFAAVGVAAFAFVGAATGAAAAAGAGAACAVVVAGIVVSG